jgi:UDP-3-O-[3-hydroxymyristoyl] glucosamine N-acyltransferase LpxD
MPSINEHNPERLAFAKKTIADTPNWMKGSSEDRIVFFNSCPWISIGEGCYIKPNVVIGSKGFSYGFEEDLTPVPIIHKGGVKIGNHVEIGALCTVVRGTVRDTILDDYVKLDDHVHIAHNCHIGRKTCIAAGVTFGGSVKVGKMVWIGHGATIMSGITIGDLAVIGSGSVVIRDVGPGEVWAGNPAKYLRMR